MRGKEKGQGKGKRADGYKNLLNKYGTRDDASEQYRFEGGAPIADVELTLNYEENGLFSKIIDIPADDAVSGGFEYGATDKDLESFINDSLDELDFEDKASEAIRWSRLYGGALMVMIIDDGGELEDPVNWDNIHGIDELLVFERPLVTPDYNSIYSTKPGDRKWSKFGMPEYYDISPVYGRAFRVHESRCLLFKNGKLPQSSTRTEYRFFGIPEHVRIHKAVQETVTSHGNGVKLLDRAVQAIYKMGNLAALLETDEGEDIVLRRLRMIDMARGIINSIAIDAEGEDYDFKSITFSGVKDIIDSACNMLSAVTNIPQTKLFGRSPAGENSTGEGDMENYYTFVGKIQKLNLKKNLGTLIDVILAAGKHKGEFAEIPDYSLTFKPLWSLSEAEQASVEQTKAQTGLTKAQTAQAYVDMQALDASEVRRSLAESGEFAIDDALGEADDWGATGEAELSNESESAETESTALTAKRKGESALETDSAEDAAPGGCGVIVVKDGRILVGTRKDNGLVCGPGGHIEEGEMPEEAAVREAREEFGIVPLNIVPLGVCDGGTGEYCDAMAYFTDQFTGNPKADGSEVSDATWLSMQELRGKQLFPPFAASLDMLENFLKKYLTISNSKDNVKSEETDGGPGSGRYPKGSGKAGKSSSGDVSATGANKFSKGFSGKNLERHWKGGTSDHSKQYPGMTKEEYAKRALDLVQKPVGGSIDGYKNSRGQVARYDKEGNDYVIGIPQKGIATMFKPSSGANYFKRLKERDGVEDE